MNIRTITTTSFTLQRAWLSLLFLFCVTLLFGQDVNEDYLKTVTNREWNISVFANTSGFGIGFQKGRTPDNFNKHFWEVDLLYSRHSKEVKARNGYYEGATNYRYGKLYNLYFLRAGYGYQRTLHHKPYWGGIMIRYTLSGGFSLGMAMPIYLKIIVFDSLGIHNYISDERYDPLRHNIDNILGHSYYFKGIWETQFRPGFYGKTGLIFDFAKKETSLQALEVGLSFDMIFPFIQQMAYNKAKAFYLCAYISYNFGKKRGFYQPPKE